MCIRPWIVVMSCLIVAGCSKAECPAGSRHVEGRCIAEHDAEVDAGAEADAGADAGACGGACSGETPVCDEASGECVECITGADCEAADAPLCVERACVECEGNGNCDSVTASRCGENNACAGCEGDEDCAHLSGTPACDEMSGTCVECMSSTDCDGNVCHPREHTCTDQRARSLEACQACVHDEECREGQLCVETSYEDPPPARSVGSYCLWKRDATGGDAPNGACGLGSRPYAQPRAATSVDGESATICELRTTTCPALLHHATAVSGCDSATVEASTACGVPDVNDGRCRLNGSGQPRCTYPCLGGEDCRPGSTCPAVGDQYCSI